MSFLKWWRFLCTIYVLKSGTALVSAARGRVHRSNESLPTLKIKPGARTIVVQMGKWEELEFSPSSPLDEVVTISFNTSEEEFVRFRPKKWNLTVNSTDATKVSVRGHQVTPHYDIDESCVICSTLDGGKCPLDLKEFFLRFKVVHSKPLHVVIIIFGWIYFVAWSVSFYPQCWLNFRRKSVKGLNFDFLGLNITGFICYAIFNCSLYFSSKIQGLYRVEHWRGANPVLLNDVFFSLHAVALCAFTIFQCLIYDRGNQRVSRTCWMILSAMWLFMLVCLILGVAQAIDWLLFINLLSGLKLVVTLLKYIPQAYMNYKRRSTLGWSIGNVLLDFTGGSMSMLQMFLMAYNMDDWGEIFGNFTKFGLGFISLLFDLLFITQHYILYRGSPPEEYPEIISEDEGGIYNYGSSCDDTVVSVGSAPIDS